MTPKEQNQKLLEELEKKIGIKFKSKTLIKEALTHRSFLNENSNWSLNHNERLEYLGDAVLEFIVTEFLFKKYPKYQEGELTSLRAALVNHVMLFTVAKNINLEKFIYLSKGEANDSSRAKNAIVSNAVEAIIGAIYLDQGYETIKNFITKNILIHLKEIIEKELFIDSKSLLQEIIQEKLKLTPTYKILEEEGPDHKKEFVAGVFFGEKIIAKGKGLSKQEAERAAAAAALKTVKTKWPSSSKG